MRVSGLRRRSSLSTHRSAFTLVELMMVLIIIGMLTTLLGVAVGYAINAAKNTAIQTDLTNLDTALQSYKNNYGSEYPTSMAIPPMTVSSTVPSRYDLFDRSLRKRFPRCTANYAAVRQILTNLPAATPPFPVWQTVSLGTGLTVTLDLDNIDAAESLVFWLAGPPRPTSATSVTTVLYGFCANPTTPFAQTGSRLPFLYEFDESRLTDVDGDGWPEYKPSGSSSKLTGVAPYVYFEPNSYSYMLGGAMGLPYAASYPGIFAINPSAVYQLNNLESSNNTSNPIWNALPGTSIYKSQSSLPPGNQLANMVGEWGFAVPYATTCKTPNPPTTMFPGNMSWWNPKKFQLIAPGLDYEYGGSHYEQQGPGRAYVPVVAQTSAQMGAPYIIPPGDITQGDNDNLTNFMGGKIEDYVPQ
ncbi:MAG TPA: type II secretion system protein [Pirellulales bacterium]|nr:type II secretion system protein [Pirellulales bacterium]